MPLSRLGCALVGLFAKGFVCAADAEPAAESAAARDAAAERRADPRVLPSLKAAAVASHRRIYGVPAYEAGPLVGLGLRSASGYVRAYATGEAFLGRTQAGLLLRGGLLGFEIDVARGRWALSLGMSTGKLNIPRVSNDHSMDSWLTARHIGIACDVHQFGRGRALFLGLRGSLEHYADPEYGDHAGGLTSMALLAPFASRIYADDDMNTVIAAGGAVFGVRL